MTLLKNFFTNFINLFKSNKVEKSPISMEEQLVARSIIHRLAEAMDPEENAWKERWIPDPTPNIVSGTFSLPSLDPKSIDPTEPIILCHYGERVPPRFKLPNGKYIHRIWRARGNRNMQPIDKTNKTRMFIWKEDLKRTCRMKRELKKQEKKQKAAETRQI